MRGAATVVRNISPLPGVTRDPNEHVGFGGGGAHFCLGANLARREIRIMFQELLTRLPDIHVTSEPDRLQSFVRRTQRGALCRGGQGLLRL